MMKRKKRDPFRFFKIEVAELLEKMNQGFMKLEETPEDPEILQALFREAHTLKGSSRLVGLTNIGEIAHWQEEFLGKIREGSAKVTSEDISHCLKALDQVEIIAQAIHDKTNPEQVDVSETLALLKQTSKVPSEPVLAQSSPLKEKTPNVIAQSSRASEELKTASIAIPQHPSSLSKPPSERMPPPLKTEAPAKTQFSSTLEGNTIRVSQERLNTLLNYTGELFINKSKLEDKLKSLQEFSSALSSLDSVLECWQRVKLSNKLRTLFSNEFELQELSNSLEKQFEVQHFLKQNLHHFIEEYQEDLKQTHAISLGLKDEAMRARMVPFKAIVTPLKRLVRGLASDLDKEIELKIIGEDVLVDKQILDDITPPLMHLIRNSVDHGLEGVEERVRSGKKATGTLTLKQSIQGNTLTLVCEDDGRGIDLKRVRTTALDKKIISPQELAEMPDAEALYLIMKPGFSTSKIVSHVSGRGVGLDVVNTVISKRRGSLSLDSEFGQWTRFTLQFPQNLASLSCLLFRCGTEKLLLPLSTVVQTLHVYSKDIETEGNQDMVKIDEKAVPLIAMKQVLSLGSEFLPPNKIPVILGSMKGEMLAFAVDQFIGVQEVVVKELDEHLRYIPNIGGATILGDGYPVILLDPVELFENANKSKGTSFVPEQNSVSTEEAAPEILVVDDSLTTRMMEKSILETAGYQVDIAIHAEDALEKAMMKQYGLLIVDVEMPGMNGFQLTQALKDTEEYEDIPIIIVSSLCTPEVKRKGIDAGAQAYIVKGEFNQSTLLDLVESLL